MKKNILKQWPIITASGLYLFLGGYLLLVTTNSIRPFSQTDLVWDLIWLDVWSLAFVFTLILLWLSPLTNRSKRFLSIGSLSLFAVVLVALMLNGTEFGYNGYFGDQKFRTAQVLHFMKLGWNSDFFYKGLPNFYPPVYYRILTAFAWLFNLEAYQMMKAGVMLLGALTPPLVFISWRKIAGVQAALIISLLAIFFCRDGYTGFVFGPHQFLGYILFIPWWLYYIERVRGTAESWRFYILGSIFGALIFSTYFYPFFIGALLIALRVTLLRRWNFLAENSNFSIGSASRLLALSALFSAPYWFPVLQSIAQFGSDRSRGGWHHQDSVGVSSIFSTVSVEGLLALAALVYLARRYQKPLNRGLIILVGATLGMYFFGSLTGAFGWTLNIVKARDFMVFLAMPIVGLALSAGWRFCRREVRLKYPFIIVCLALALYGTNQINAVTGTPNMLKARKSVVPTWGTDAKEMAEATGKVFLADHEELFSFYPVYTFISKNEHYTHPASRFKARYDFLNVLSEFSDSELFHLALSYNRYDRVEHFMPGEKDGKLRINIALSNYPDTWSLQTLEYAKELVTNRKLFKPLTGWHHYQLMPATYREAGFFESDPQENRTDSLLTLVRLRILRAHLTSEGQGLFDRYLGVDWVGWESVTSDDRAVRLAPELELLGGASVVVGDSLLFQLCFEPQEDFDRPYKMFVHQFLSDGTMNNLDFVPAPSTRQWKKLGRYDIWRWIPRVQPGQVIHVGLFNGPERLGGPISIPIGQKTQTQPGE